MDGRIGAVRRSRLLPHPMPMGLLVTFHLIGLASGLPDATAQNFQFARQRGPYYVGEPVVMQIIASGFEAGQQPTCRLLQAPAAGVTVQGPQVSQSSQSFTRIINGRMSHSESIDYRFSFVATADREGSFQIGPFEISYDGVTQTVDGDEFQFGQLDSDPDMQIELTVPQDSIYVGQEVPVTIRWSFAGETEAVQYAFANLQIRSPLFDQFPLREPSRQGRTTLSIATAKGSLDVDAEVTQEQRDGQRVVVVSGTVTMVPDTPGKYESIPITCRTKRVTRWSRDLFGDLTARDSVPALAAGTPLSLEVKPIPLADQPASFSGAVGRGYSLEVSANRSVVRVGDPISLTITVRGNGNLEQVVLPDLSANPGFTSDLFQIPAEPAAGTLHDQGKQFKVTVRVKDERITQIPPLAFSWFDPWEGQFHTSESKPIALQVMAAQVISAADVVSAAPAREADAGGNGGETPAVAHSRETPTEAWSFVGANLAIERDARRLLAGAERRMSGEAAVVVVYGMAFAAMAAGVMVRRRSQRDMRPVQQRKRLKGIRQRIVAATHRPPREAADGIARGLRELVAHYDVVRRGEAETVVARCEGIIYATGPGVEERVPELVQQALTLVDDAARSV